MATYNTYIKYKQDERQLASLITHASTLIIKKFPDEAPEIENITITGDVSLTAIKSLSKLIAKYTDPIPPIILRLFDSVIQARKETHRFYCRFACSNPDPDVQRSNRTHVYWIDGLVDAFNALGGDFWREKSKVHSNVPDEDEVEVIFANAFSTLSLDSESRSERYQDIHDSGSDGSPERNTKLQSRRKFTKGRVKSKKGRKQKGKPNTKKDTPVLEASNIPLESYRIIDDENGTRTEYLMAVYSLVQQMTSLRHELQNVWQEATYQDLNTAIASSVSNVAIGIIKTTQSQIFVDFPEHDSFDIVMQTLTRGDPDKSQGMFHFQSAFTGPNEENDKSSSDLDVREELFLHAYQDLFDFITDFQKTHSGKPTKPMLKCLQNWDPEFNLQQATKEQRLSWRRSFTINWLYDLVNVYSSILVHHPAAKEMDINIETVDWSKNGPWYDSRRLYGLNEFAGAITHMAMQKFMQGNNIKSSILPHHVFQLQCIVDSLTVSRGWKISTMTGHVLNPPAAGFRPRRDVDVFMDREAKRGLRGLYSSVAVLIQLLDQDTMVHGDPKRNETYKEIVLETGVGMVDWLGETLYSHGMEKVPPSRFSNTNSNGLWEYSPFLCGAGLSEALDQMCAMGLHIWDELPEVICNIHLHNMLLHKGLLEQPIGLWETLKYFFQDAFFRDGKIPTSSFGAAFDRLVTQLTSHRIIAQNRAQKVGIANTAKEVADFFESSLHRFFKTRSVLRVLQKAEWDFDRIPDGNIPFPTMLAFLRINEAKKTRDPVTGKVTLPDNDLIKRIKLLGVSDEEIIAESSRSVSTIKRNPSEVRLEQAIKKQHNDEKLEKATNLIVREKYTPDTSPGTRSASGNGTDLSMYLNAVKQDLIGDISGTIRPISSLNYILILALGHMFFMGIENKLKHCGNSTWREVYEGGSVPPIRKRLSFTLKALEYMDPECLKIIKETFEEHPIDFTDCTWWDG